MTDVRVLIVDDDAAIRVLVSKIVERSGILVDTARDGHEALEKLRTGSFQVMVLDLMMPNMSGYEVLDELRKSPQPPPATIVISAGTERDLRRLSGQLVHSIVPKPFDITLLGDLISATAKEIAAAKAADETGPRLLQFPNQS